MKNIWKRAPLFGLGAYLVGTLSTNAQENTIDTEFDTGMSVISADFENDGDQDYIMASRKPGPRDIGHAYLYTNNGNGKFSRSYNPVGEIPMEARTGIVAVAGNFDGDEKNLIDFILIARKPGTKDIGHAFMYKNLGNNKFKQTTYQPIFTLPTEFRSGLGASIININNDKYPDLVVAARKPGPEDIGYSQIYVNNEGTTFRKF